MGATQELIDHLLRVLSKTNSNTKLSSKACSDQSTSIRTLVLATYMLYSLDTFSVTLVLAPDMMYNNG
jgi:hypothetical protein